MSDLSRSSSRRDRLLADGWEDCDTCGGEGFILVDTTVVVAGHAHSCNGETCERTCPVPVPTQGQEQEDCPDCVDGLVPNQRQVEAAAVALAEQPGRTE